MRHATLNTLIVSLLCCLFCGCARDSVVESVAGKFSEVPMVTEENPLYGLDVKSPIRYYYHKRTYANMPCVYACAEINFDALREAWRAKTGSKFARKETDNPIQVHSRQKAPNGYFPDFYGWEAYDRLIYETKALERLSMYARCDFHYNGHKGENAIINVVIFPE